MTIRTRSQINNDADQYLPDNETGEISPAAVRQRVKDLTDSTLFPGELEVKDFLPSLTFGGNAAGIAYQARNGAYIEMPLQNGRSLIHLELSLWLSNKGTSTGLALISLPKAPFRASGGGLLLSGWTGITNGSAFQLLAGLMAMRLFYNGTSFITDANATHGAAIDANLSYIA